MNCRCDNPEYLILNIPVCNNKKIETVLNSNKMGGYHDKKWTGLSEKMFDWTNDFPDVKCRGPNCTKIHPEDNEYYVPE